MLTLYHDGKQYPIDNTEYYIRELSSGLDEVIFSISIHDPIYAILQEEEQVTDRAGQRYLVKQIDAGASTAKVICQIDLDDWKSRMLVEYNSGSLQVGAQIEKIAPTGWTVEDRSLITMRRTIQGDYTPFGVCEACRNIYQVYIRWDNARKVCTIISKALADPVGSFATRQLNLKEINYKGKSTGFITRLYCYGKRNDAGVALSLQGATINGSTYQYPYVENHSYSDKVICGYWIDERYTDPQSLYDDALAKLKVMAIPDRSYDCAIVDLQATNPELYGNLDFSLFTTATLIDDIKNTAINYMVVERHVYPYHPESNEVIFSSSPIKITNELTNIVETVENPNSAFQQIMSTRIEAATNWLLSGDGYVVAVKDDQGNWKELLFMDTADIATAQKVLRINEHGIGFSRTGANGPYANAWTIDGQLVADFITTGTMSANRVRTGTLESVDKSVIFDLDAGTLTMGNKALRITAGNLQLDANGNVKVTGTITAAAGSKIGPWDVSASAITYNNGAYGTSGLYFGTSGISLGNTFKVSAAGVLSCSGASISGTLTAKGDSDGDVVIGGGRIRVPWIEFYTQSGNFAASWTTDNSTSNGNSGYHRLWCGYGIRLSGESSTWNWIENPSIIDANTYFKAGVFDENNGLQFTSDRRKKQDITYLDSDDAAERVMKLKPARFKFTSTPNVIHHGFIAQDVQEIIDDGWNVVEEYIDLETQETRLSLRYTEIIADLVAAVQSQNRRITALERRTS